MPNIGDRPINIHNDVGFLGFLHGFSRKSLSFRALRTGAFDPARENASYLNRRMLRKSGKTASQGFFPVSEIELLKYNPVGSAPQPNRCARECGGWSR